MQVGSASINTTDRMIDNTITVVCGHDAAQETNKSWNVLYTSGYYVPFSTVFKSSNGGKVKAWLINVQGSRGMGGNIRSKVGKCPSVPHPNAPQCMYIGIHNLGIRPFYNYFHYIGCDGPKFSLVHCTLMGLAAFFIADDNNVTPMHTALESSLNYTFYSLAVAVGKFATTFALCPSAPSPFLTASTSTL